MSATLYIIAGFNIALGVENMRRKETQFFGAVQLFSAANCLMLA